MDEVLKAAMESSPFKSQPSATPGAGEVPKPPEIRA
jgi:hypothetical protein